MKQGSAKARPLCGAAAVAALVAAVALGSCGGGPGGPQPIPTGGHTMGTMAQLVFDGMTAEQALAAQGYAAATPDDVPPWFDAEVLPASRCEGCFAAEGWQVVGLSMAGAADEVFDSLLADLAERGWCAYESGIDHAATLTKEEGEAQWMMMQCATIGGSTSVVLQLSRSSC